MTGSDVLNQVLKEFNDAQIAKRETSTNPTEQYLYDFLYYMYQQGATIINTGDEPISDKSIVKGFLAK